MSGITYVHQAIDKKTTGGTRVITWDGWRGTAIVLVLCGHFYDIQWLWEDRMGVDVFFVLSGMLMSNILYDKRLRLKDFYIRRLSRVYPVLFVYVVVIYSVSWFEGLNFSSSEIVSSLLFLRTYYPQEPGIWSSEVAAGHLWSLNVEEHAYVLLSLISLVLINRKYIALLLLALGCVCIALNFYHYSNISPEEFKLYLIRTESAIVFILFSAGYGLLKRQANWQGHPMLTTVCLLGAILCYAKALPIWLVFCVSPILLSIVVNHLDNLPTFLERVFSLKLLRYLGICSYSIYIWQQPFFIYSWAIPIPKPAILLIGVAVGVASYLLFENPIRHHINSRWSNNPVYLTKQ